MGVFLFAERSRRKGEVGIDTSMMFIHRDENERMRGGEKGERHQEREREERKQQQKKQ